MARDRSRRFNAKARSFKRGDAGVTAPAPAAVASAAGAAPFMAAMDGGSNALVLPSKSPTSKTTAAPALAKKKSLSAKQRRRMDAFVEKQLKKERRADVIKKLAETTYAMADPTLLRSSKQLGKKDTVKERLRRALLEERAGIPVSDTSTRLLVPVGQKRSAADIDDGSNSEEASTDDEDLADDYTTTLPPPPQQPLKTQQAGASTTAPAVQVSSATKPTTAVPRTFAFPSPLTTAPREPETILSSSDKKPAFYVPVQRDPTIQAKRLELPILAEEQVIMETINSNLFVIVAGETGSGKTTQVPQFLYEAGYGNPESDRPGKIGITQPRRVAAVAMTARVAAELNVPRDRVSYQIRYDGTVNPATAIQFMTDGVLLKEIASDFLLKNYSVIILDEAHERNLNTDILIGLLSRLVPLRDRLSREGNILGPTGKPLKPLRVIIMSATLRVQDFTENKVLFPTGPPPVISIDARQYPVTIHFNKRTPLNDYITDAYKKVCQIHRRLPTGGILVFVTGVQEIEMLCRKLRERFPSSRSKCALSNETTHPERADHKGRALDDDEAKETALGLDEDSGSLEVDDEEEDVLANFENFARDRKSRQVADGMIDPDDDDGSALVQAEEDEIAPLYVLPLYALLSPIQQMRVFEAVPDGHRLCVVATNVAETSITIPNIKYVVDTGKAKERHHDPTTGVQSFRVGWISKASANQRSGRAGRTGPGHCYRLYSSAVYDEHFPQFSTPEVQRIPIEATVLMMKAMNIDNVVNFPFPSPPDRSAIARGEKLLVVLGALVGTTKQITALGRQMAVFPLSPRYAKMILAGEVYKVEHYMVALVAAMTVGDLFVRNIVVEENADANDPDTQEEQRLQRSQYRKAHGRFTPPSNTGDLHKYLYVVNAYERSTSKEAFCDENLLRHKAMSEVAKLRKQLLGILNSLRSSRVFAMDLVLADPTPTQNKILSQVVIAGFMDQVAVRNKDAAPGPRSSPYKSMLLNEDVFIHPTSVQYRLRPDWVVYTDVVESKHKYLKGVTEIDPRWLAKVAPDMCFFGKPVENPPPRYDSTKDAVLCVCAPTYGPRAWSLPPLEVPFPESLDRYKHFARFLLEGQVCPPLVPLVPHLVSKPTIINKSWTQPKIIELVQALQTAKIASRATLEAKWRETPTFLYSAIQQWVDRSQHATLQSIWPPIAKPLPRSATKRVKLK